jgi:diguanylate cyclase (GGDEF)-like protein
MKQLQTIGTFTKEVISLLEEDELNKKYLISQIHLIARTSRGSFYSKLMELFVHLTFQESEAKKHWKNVLTNFRYFNRNLERNVGLRVAMFDYFINLNKMMQNPILVEIHFFRETARLAMIDGLTGIFNRRYFDLAFRKEQKRAVRHNKNLSLCIMDIDDFKTVNDTYGHLFGDDVLRSFSTELKETCREEDIVCRYGGEEFVVILPETDGQNAFIFAERFRETLKKKGLFKKHKISFSCGIATCPIDGVKIVQLIKSADKALYAAKFSGKDCVIKWSKSDKRRFKRYKKAWKLSYEPVERAFEGDSISEVNIIDISVGGVSFKTKEPLGSESRLLLNIKLPGNDYVIVVGKIKWLKKIKKDVFAYGIQFYDMNNDQLDKIKKLIVHRPS